MDRHVSCVKHGFLCVLSFTFIVYTTYKDIYRTTCLVGAGCLVVAQCLCLDGATGELDLGPAYAVDRNSLADNCKFLLIAMVLLDHCKGADQHRSALGADHIQRRQYGQ